MGVGALVWSQQFVYSIYSLGLSEVIQGVSVNIRENRESLRIEFGDVLIFGSQKVEED